MSSRCVLALQSIYIFRFPAMQFTSSPLCGWCLLARVGPYPRQLVCLCITPGRLLRSEPSAAMRVHHTSHAVHAFIGGSVLPCLANARPVIQDALRFAACLQLLNYFMPKRGILPLHSGCNIGDKGDVTLFFGLSGAG